MSKKLYVGSLAYCIGKNELEKIFGEVGTVVSAKAVIDAATGQGKGFGFVEMSSIEEAALAILHINGAAHGGRNLVVKAAKSDNKGGNKGAGNRRTGGRPTSANGGGRAGTGNGRSSLYGGRSGANSTNRAGSNPNRGNWK
jgi:RNA recognition motif-containing protein